MKQNQNCSQLAQLLSQKKMVSLLNVGVSKIRSTKKFDPKWGTSNQIATKMEPSTVKSKDFCIRLEVSLENKVYLETYYHHSHDDIQMDEKLAKIQV